MKTLVILASGRGSNAAALVAATRAGGVLHGLASVSTIVSNDAHSAVVARREELDTPVVVVPSAGLSREAWEDQLLRRVEIPDYWGLAGFRRILSPAFVRRFVDRIVNVHPADTSQHQGLHGYAWAFEARLSETFVTVHLVDEGIDTGRVLAKQRVDLRGATSLVEVEARGLAVEHVVYPCALRALLLERAA